MIKTIAKETFIMILLCAAVTLILAIAFYDYIPTNKTVPQTVKYAMPEELSEIKSELESSVENKTDKVVLSLKIDDEDLAGYKRTKVYNPGKANPFEAYSEQTSTQENDDTKTTDNTNTQNTTNTSNSNSNTNSNSSGRLFDDGKTK